MKKLLPIAVVALFGALTFASCKKTNSSGQYTCSCTYKGSSTGTDTTTKTTFGTGTTQSQASSACNTLQSDYRLVDASAACHL